MGSSLSGSALGRLLCLYHLLSLAGPFEIEPRAALVSLAVNWRDFHLLRKSKAHLKATKAQSLRISSRPRRGPVRRKDAWRSISHISPDNSCKLRDRKQRTL